MYSQLYATYSSYSSDFLKVPRRYQKSPDPQVHYYPKAHFRKEPTKPSHFLIDPFPKRRNPDQLQASFREPPLYPVGNNSSVVNGRRGAASAKGSSVLICHEKTDPRSR